VRHNSLILDIKAIATNARKFANSGHKK